MPWKFVLCSIYLRRPLLCQSLSYRKFLIMVPFLCEICTYLFDILCILPRLFYSSSREISSRIDVFWFLFRCFLRRIYIIDHLFTHLSVSVVPKRTGSPIYLHCQWGKEEKNGFLIPLRFQSTHYQTIHSRSPVHVGIVGSTWHTWSTHHGGFCSLRHLNWWSLINLVHLSHYNSSFVPSRNVTRFVIGLSAH